MLIFLSWSGARSKAMAEVFGPWISRVIQAVDPWMSPDIEKGARWSPEIAGRLEKSRVGLICLTSENLIAPWILFEAGAISKPKDGYVCTLLLDVRPSEIEQPLGQFQHTLSRDREDVLKLVRTINSLVQKADEKALPDGLLEEVFNDSWPRLAEKLAALAAQPIPGGRHARPQTEILEEILELVRSQERRFAALAQAQASSAVRQLLSTAEAHLLDDASKEALREFVLARARHRGSVLTVQPPPEDTGPKTEAPGDATRAAQFVRSLDGADPVPQK